jgi:hypothetical protein
MTTHFYLTMVLILAALLSGCGTTGHVSVMHDVAGDVDTAGQNPLCTFAVRRKVWGPISGQIYHQSWCSSGFPFNDNAESTVDGLGAEAQIW